FLNLSSSLSASDLTSPPSLLSVFSVASAFGVCLSVVSGGFSAALVLACSLDKTTSSATNLRVSTLSAILITSAPSSAKDQSSFGKSAELGVLPSRRNSS